MNFYKKALFVFMLVFFGLIFGIKFSLSSLENRILEISKSERFYNFIEQRFRYELNRLSEKELTIEEAEFYSDRINKIIKKLKPVTNKIEK